MHFIGQRTVLLAVVWLFISPYSLEQLLLSQVINKEDSVVYIIGHSVASEEAVVFQQIGKSVNRISQVPFRAPINIPYAAHDHPIYVSIVRLDREGYEVDLSWQENCNGNNYCHIGSLNGSLATLVEENRVKLPVKLNHGKRGYFIDSTCRTSCDESSISWEEGQYHYAVGIKAGHRALLVGLANSAITDVAVYSKP